MIDLLTIRHIKEAQNRPKILQQRQRQPPDRNTCLKIGHTIEWIENPEVTFFFMGIIFFDLIVAENMMLWVVLLELFLEKLAQGVETFVQLVVGIL